MTNENRKYASHSAASNFASRCLAKAPSRACERSCAYSKWFLYVDTLPPMWNAVVSNSRLIAWRFAQARLKRTEDRPFIRGQGCLLSLLARVSVCGGEIVAREGQLSTAGVLAGDPQDTGSVCGCIRDRLA